MGQKINPKGFRLGLHHTWSSRWFANDNKRYRKLLLQDVRIREALMKKLQRAGIAKVEIERSINKIDIIIFVSRPGVVIGRGGRGLEEIKKFIEEFFKNKEKGEKVKIEVKIEPVKEPNLDAYLVAQSVAEQLAKRLPHKRVVRRAIEKVMAAGAKGVKITLSGRIAGAEIARTETYKEGRIPLSTLRENIDFAKVPSLTKSGYIGVKVWICK